MSLIVSNFASEGGHWYMPDGAPFYTIIGANGVERPVTLRDARKVMAVPSVTTITKCAAAPGLENWKLQQMKLAALTLPRKEGESEKDWLDRVDQDSREQAKKAAERGSTVHGWLESFYRGEQPTEEAWPFVKAVKEVIERETGVHDWRPEKSFCHPLGYGGKCDLHSDLWVIDYKTKNQIEDGKKLAWDDHAQQLAAYREGFGIPKARCANVFVTTTEPVKVVWHEHEAEELERGWQMFKCLLRYWQIKNRYVPELKAAA